MVRNARKLYANGTFYSNIQLIVSKTEVSTINIKKVAKTFLLADSAIVGNAGRLKFH